ncbi:MAG TPA: hypothetical protein VL356_02525 [Acidocella sp.]|nr:hypothetical protein [Acidocella sp.]
MTPLAQRIVKRISNGLPAFDRQPENGGQVFGIDDLINAKCFDISEVVELGNNLVESFFMDDSEKKYHKIPDLSKIFTPFPRTWIEWSTEGLGRSGVLLGDFNVKKVIYGAWVTVSADGKTINLVFEHWLESNQNENGGWLTIPPPSHRIVGSEYHSYTPEERRKSSWMILNIIARTYCYLSIINSPKVIARAEFPAHTGLIKSLRHTNVIPKDSGLRDWTKVYLHVDPTEAGFL